MGDFDHPKNSRHQIRDGQILRSSRSRSSRSSRSGDHQIEIIKIQTSDPQDRYPKWVNFGPPFWHPWQTMSRHVRDCHKWSNCGGNKGLWPLGHSSLITTHHMVWNPVRTSQKWSKKGHQTRSHGGFRPLGKSDLPIYTVARARRGFPRENDPFLTTFGPLRTPFGRVSP